MTASSAEHSVYMMGATKAPIPDFGSLGKATTTVDVGRLQTELLALHGRLELLESAAIAAAARVENHTDVDMDPGSSGVAGRQVVEAIITPAENAVNRQDDEHITTVDQNSEGTLEEMTGCSDPLRSSGAGRKKGGGAVTAAMRADIRHLSERMEALAASAKRQDKSRTAKEKSMELARTMEINRMQLAIDARVTSDDLAQAVNANSDKIVAVQSAVDTALSDRFRRMQDMVHAQMTGLLQMVQALTQQSNARRGSAGNRGSFSTSHGLASADSGEEDSDGSSERNHAFVKAVTDVVKKLQRESDKNRKGVVDSATFESFQEDYETFKIRMEDRGDLQESMASSLEDAQARLEEAEANIAALTEEMEISAREMQEGVELANTKQAKLDELTKKASSLAADANAECAATRELVVNSRREGLLDARKEAEAIAARAEGRAKAEVQKARGDARTATEHLASELKRHVKTIADEDKARQNAVTSARSLSEKAMAGATAAEERVAEMEVCLQRVENKIIRRLDEAIQNQVASADDIMERVAAGETELARAEDELNRLTRANAGDIEVLRSDIAKLRESSRYATEDLRVEVQDALATAVLDQNSEQALGSDRGGGGGRSSTRGGGGGGGGRGGGTSGTRGGDSSKRNLASIGDALRRQGGDMAQSVVTLQRSGVGIVTVLRKMEAGLQALSTKDLFWKAVDTKLAAHQRSVGDVCLQVESATATRRSRITLPQEAQTCLAGDMQRVAKLMAVKADFEIIRELAKLEGPEQTGEDWDQRVEYLRQTQMQRFLRDCRDALDKRAPEVRTNFKGEEVREKFLGKLSDALKVALSKYAPTTPGATLFGKIKLKAKACVACDRPFTPSATGRPGPTPAGGMSGAAVDQELLPEENSHITKDTFRPHTSHGRLGSPSRSGSSPDLFEPQHTMTHSRSSPGSPHVYRGGFKLPKHLKSPLHASEGEDQSAFGIGHASPLLHKSPSMTGLFSGPTDGGPSTSGGMHSKGRPPTNTQSHHHHGQFPPPGAVVGDETGSIKSAFTFHADVGQGASGGGSWSGGGRGGRASRGRGPEGIGGAEGTGFADNGGRDVPQQDDDYCSKESRAGVNFTPPYYAAIHANSRPSTHDGSVRLLP